MNGYELPIGITAFAAAIAAQAEDTREIRLFAAAALQLGYSLELIAIQRERCEDSKERFKL